MDMLFFRRREALTGGHLKLRDYIGHTAASGLYRPVLQLSGVCDPGVDGSGLFDDAPGLRIAHPRPADAYFVAGDDWRSLDEAGIDPAGRPVVNLVQGFRHLEPGSFLRACLGRPALRICVSSALADAVRPLANGPVRVAPTAIAPPHVPAIPGGATGIFIGGAKDGALAEAVAAALEGAATVDLARGPLRRDEYLMRIARAQVAVLLPLPQEGFFLPPLEAMHLGTAVVTCDCLGARDYCQDQVNSRVVARDAGALADAARRLLADAAGRCALVAVGQQTAARRTIAKERAAYVEHLRALATRCA